ncbi:MAG: Na+:solute symporter [Phycisphaerae bacterium]|nr:Na+:solute symporter [Phycisphaerae bacterium]
MNWIDWIVVGASCVLIMGIGLAFAKRGSGSMTDFFLAGRKMPWWLAGLSMMATNFASDTPLHQSGNARRGGFLGFWFYVPEILRELSISFFFARLWRRARILTDVEFFELRHGAESAKILRIAVASYNCFIYAPLKIGLFTLAMSKIASVVFQMPETLHFAGYSFSSHIALSIGVVAFAMIYSAASGLWGVAVTDVLEWLIAITGTYALMFFAFKATGGPSGLIDKLKVISIDGRLSFDPSRLSPVTFFSPVLILLFSPHWWFADGELAVTQRLMACRNEKDAMMSQLMRTAMNFTVRSLPWIICGMASIVILADVTIDDPNDAYPMLIHKLMPHGLLGLMMVSFLAAFLSSADMYLNLGSAYFMNDIYRRFIVKHREEHHYVAVSKLVTITMAILGIIVAVMSSSVWALFKLMLLVMSGTIMIRALRWFWWRINGWTLVSAIVASTVTAITFSVWQIAYFEPNGFMNFFKVAVRPPTQWIIDTLHITDSSFPQYVYFTVDLNLIMLIVAIVWITTMFLTRPDPIESLKEFYRRVRPAGIGWKPIAKLCPEVKITDSFSADFMAWVIGCTFCYSAFFTAAAMYFTKWKIGAILLTITIAAGVLLKFKVLDRYSRMAAIDKQLEDEASGKSVIKEGT